MSIPKDQAQALLRAAEVQMSRTAMLQTYQRMSDYLLVWGSVWLLAYLGTACWPQYVSGIWIGLDAVGMLATVLLQRRGAGQSSNSATMWGTLAAIGVAFAFVWASLAVFQPVSSRQISTFITLLVALAYAVTGLRVGRRITLAGLALGALAMLGFYTAKGTYFQIWMGLAGGGTLIATGIWLKRV